MDLDYLRSRRNRVVHSEGESKGELADFVRNKGNSLQKYWQHTLRRGLYGMDFQSMDTDRFSKEEFFDFINIWRLLTSKMDSALCKKIGRKEIIIQLHEEFIKKRRMAIKRWGMDKSKLKFKGYAQMEFGLSLSDGDMDNLTFVGEVA